MQEEDKNKSIKKIFNSKLFLISLILVALFVGAAAFRSFYRDYQVNQEIERLKAKVDSLEREKIESMKLLDYVASKRFVEKKARSDLNLKKKGEKAMIIKDSDINSKNSDDKETNQVSNPVKWWYYFTNKNLSN
ncbi:MAG: septum formation initiator family protein [Candidatus Magasanikbacteria bacterium]